MNTGIRSPLNRIHIAQVGLGYSPDSGGTTRAMEDFAQALNATTISFTASRSISTSAEVQPNAVIHIPCDGIAGRLYAWSQDSLALEEAESILRKSDVIICHQLFRYHVQWAANIAKRSGIPYWVIPHGILDPYVFSYRGWQKKIWMKAFGQRILRDAAFAVFSTETERKKANPYLHAVNTHVIKWPVDYVDTSRKALAREQVRTQHRIPQDARLLLFLGRLHPMKRPLEIMDALSLSNQSSLHLLVVGPDSDVLSRRQSEEYCTKNNINNVRFAGPVYGKDRYDLFMAADGYVNLSARENFGYAVGEALASALPVILSPGNDLAPELLGVDCGWLLESDFTTDLASAMSQFAQCSNESLIESGLRGQDWARKNLSFERFSASLRSLVDRTNLETPTMKQQVSQQSQDEM
jgi:glycosyltransferase involved in cell wall biosynthesis